MSTILRICLNTKNRSWHQKVQTTPCFECVVYFSAKYGLFGTSLGLTSSPTSSSKTTTASSTATSSHTSSSTRGRRSTPGGRGRPRKLVKQPAIPLSLVQSTSILSPSMLEKYVKKVGFVFDLTVTKASVIL